jgi:hypothetical protein
MGNRFAHGGEGGRPGAPDPGEVRPTTITMTGAPARWAVRAAHLIPLLTLPSGLWRVPMAFGSSMGMLDHGAPVRVTPGVSMYVLCLSVACEAAALLSFGLVRPWGEVLPDWLPVLGGRRVPRLATTVVAAAGAAALTAIWAFAIVNLLVLGEADLANGWWAALLAACYLPLLLWGPLLGALAVDYYRRTAARISV